MSDPSPALDPYRSPETGHSGAPAIARPAGLTVICVLAIVLGAFGLISAVLGAGGTLFGRQLQSLIAPTAGPGMSEDFVTLQRQMNDEMLAVTEKYQVVILLLLLVLFVVAVALIAGGLKTMSLKTIGRTILMSTCGGAILFELVRGIFQLFMSMETMPIVSDYSARMSEALGSGGGALGGEQMAGFMSMLTYVGVCMAVLMILAKVSFYSCSLLYLRKPRIKALFEPSLQGADA